MRAGLEYSRNFESDAKDFYQMSETPLPMPVLVITGEKSSGNFLIEQTKRMSSNVQGLVLPGSGQWLIEKRLNGDTCDPQLHQLISEVAELKLRVSII